MPRRIVVRDHGGLLHASRPGKPGFGVGRTTAEAIGNLVLAHAEDYGVIIEAKEPAQRRADAKEADHG